MVINNIDEDFVEEILTEDLETRVESNNPHIISENDLKRLNRCPYSYFLAKNYGLTNIPKSAIAVQAILFEQGRKKLFNLRDPNLKIGRIFPRQHRAGPELKTAEQMNKKELRKYLACNPGKLGGSLYAPWKLRCQSGTFAQKPLVFNFEKQSPLNWDEDNFEKRIRQYYSRKTNPLLIAGNNYQKFVLENGAPLTGFINKRVSFKFKGHTFLIKFPELRKGMIIDDPTIWSFNHDLHINNNKNDIDTSPLVTLRILAYHLLAADPANQFRGFYRRKWGIKDEIADSWIGKTVDKPVNIDEKVQYRHFNASKYIIAVTFRKSTHLDDLERVIDNFLEQIEKEHFPPNPRYCSSCPYNTLDLNGEQVCPQAKKGAKPSVPIYYYDKTNFSIKTEKEDNNITLTGMIRKNKNVTKKVSQYRLNLLEDERRKDLFEKEKIIKVTSSYHCHAYGLGFEELMLTETDKQLQNLANDLKKPVIHQINFEKDFKHDGQNKIIDKLTELGYQNNKKEYKPN